MADILKKIIDYLNNDNLSEAFNLCEKFKYFLHKYLTVKSKKLKNVIKY